MTESEALEICRAAAKRAAEKSGYDRHAAVQDLVREAEADPKLQEAMAVVGYLLVHADQDKRH